MTSGQHFRSEHYQEAYALLDKQAGVLKVFQVIEFPKREEVLREYECN